MRDVYPIALLIGGLTLIGIGQAFAGLQPLLNKLDRVKRGEM